MKYVLISGASGGMGTSVVKELLDEGYFVFALDNNLSQGLKSITTQQKNLQFFKVDLTDSQSIQDAYTKVSSITNELYAILHFAGKYVLDSLIEIPEQKFVNAFDVNVFGAYRLNKTFIPLLNRGGRIILTTSELAPLDPLPFTGVYALTKSLLDKYAYSLRMEVQLKDIFVIVLRPGAIKTDMLDVSTTQLDEFCKNTKEYSVNAKKFKQVVDKVESRNILPQKIAKKTAKILSAKNPKYVYTINRNPLLLLLNALPDKLQTRIIKGILK